ncbi:MAG: amidase family protein [Desulfobacterales bacterium]|nr:amidase family protein [Desulfobacterales bacterium]MDX2510993.1 amidase family protein [Desulfobacterales bacterium]
MESFKEYDQYDGLGLADLVRKKELTSEELCETAIERIEESNPEINAVITPMFDKARAAAKTMKLEGPFSGVPFLLKDLMAAYAGVPLNNGCKGLRNYIPAYDSELVKRFKSAGVNVLGKTNTPEFGLVAYTEPELHGPTRNPWNTEHTPGGSSGGSAAAVASGMVPLASGGDGGGSIRIPSSCCGLFGLKPTRGRTPTGPNYGELWEGATIEHVITRSVRDSAAMLDATCAPDIGAPYIIQQPERPYLDEIEREPGKLRIAFNSLSPLETSVHPEIVKATLETALMLQKLGHDVDEDVPEIDGRSLAMSYLSMYFGEVAADIDELRGVLGREVCQDDVETLTWTLGLLGRSTSAFSFVKAIRMWGQASRRMARFHEKYDVYLTPTMAHPPIRVGVLKLKPLEKAVLRMVNTLGLGKLLKRTGIVEKLAIENLSKTPFTQLANFTGQPAMSVPLHWTSDGLPCGMHFMAPMGDEATLFRLAKQLETEKPWFDKRPKPNPAIT